MHSDLSSDLLLVNLPTRARLELEKRLRLLFETLTGVTAANDHAQSSLQLAVEQAGTRGIWLTWAVVRGTLPTVSQVRQLQRHARLQGLAHAIKDLIGEAASSGEESWPEVEVVTGKIVVDVHHTSSMAYSTGIQRVVRQTVTRWAANYDPLLVAWDPLFKGMRTLTAAEQQWLFSEPSGAPRTTQRGLRRRGSARHGHSDGTSSARLVPWRCTHVIPELATEPDRAAMYESIALFSAASTGVIGHDCIPLTAAETTDDGMPGAALPMLRATAFFDRVAATSAASQAEYLGWRAMLAASGSKGPDVPLVGLPVESPVPSEGAMIRAKKQFGVGSLPIVFVVGSHEPRKNHLAVLVAAEMLWNEGVQFALAFSGGNSWKSEDFDAKLQELQRLNRPVISVRGLPDDLLWAAYRLAYCTVFVSVHEGFGLPLAESLASGTPAVTSRIGSMQELAESGGALLADPWDDEEVTTALRRLLCSPGLRDRLAAELVRREWKTWDTYSVELWRVLVES